MDRLGVSPLVRNYHLFYSCIANTDQQLRQAVRNLGRNPTQHEIDQVIEEFCPEAVGSTTMNRQHAAVLKTLETIGAQLRSENSEMQTFTGAMDRVSQALARTIKEDKVTADVLNRVAATVVSVGTYRVRSSKRAISRMDESRSEINTLRAELIKARALANTDPLTGLANRRSFDEKLASNFSMAKRFSLILLDIDFFKRVNDVHGHSTGDQVLKAVADIFRSALRAGTFAARTGGEEFAIILQGGSDKETALVGERVRMAVEKTPIAKGDEKLSITISLGAALSSDAGTSRALYEAADAALYRSKAAGRNRMTFHKINDNDTGSERYQIYKG
jgi:diguanylate cyclase